MSNINEQAYISDLYDKKISFAIIAQFCMLITNYTFKEVFDIVDTANRELVSLISMLLVGVLFLFSFRIVYQRISKIIIGSYFGFAFLFLFNILFFNDNIEYIFNISFYFFLICIPILLYYLAIRDKSIFENMLIKSAYFQIIMAAVFFIHFEGSYNMVFSYLVMVPVIILIHKMYNTKLNIIDSVLIIMGVYSIVIIGSRGPLVAIAFYFFIRMIIDILECSTSKRLIKIGTLIVIFGLSFYFFETMSFISDDYGISSRTILLFMNKDVDFSTGRSDIYQLTVEKIASNPIIGYGLAGDRVFLDGTYPHNIFLEILVQFGIFFGSIILVVFIFYWFSGIFLNKSKQERDLAIMFFCIGLVQLFVSSSYLTSSNFWLFMAICINSVHCTSNIYRN